MTVGLEHYLILSALLFTTAVMGMLINRKNVIVILMCMELMLLAVDINMVAFGKYLGDLTGQIFTFFILTVAAAEVAIGLAILTLFFRHRKSIRVDEMVIMKG